MTTEKAERWPLFELPAPLLVAVGLIIVGLLSVGWAYFGYMAWAVDASATGLPHHHHAAHSHGGLWSPPVGSETPWGAFDFAMLFVMWVMMMLAMMLPAVTPFVFLYARLSHQRRLGGGAAAPTFVFISGYLLAWAIYSIGATVLQWLLHTRELITPAMESDSQLLSGIILLLAGVYQWTTLKDACLKHCHTPMGYLLTHWRDGYIGAVRMGLGHGAFCVGCCWALMLVMLAVGMMNMLWLLVLTLFIFLEKTLIPIRVGRMVTGLVMLVWGAYWTVSGLNTGMGGGAW